MHAELTAVYLPTDRVQLRLGYQSSCHGFVTAVTQIPQQLKEINSDPLVWVDLSSRSISVGIYLKLSDPSSGVTHIADDENIDVA